MKNLNPLELQTVSLVSEAEMNPINLAQVPAESLPLEQPVTIPNTFMSRVIRLSPVLISIALSIVGQLLLKVGMSQIGPVSLTDRSLLDTVLAIATNLWVIVGMAIFAGSMLFWLVGLSRVPLSYAYPFLSLSYVAILIASHFFLGESISLLRIVGVFVICAGVVIVALSDTEPTGEKISEL